MAGNIDPDFPHHLDSFRMNVTRRLRPSTLHIDQITRGLPQNAFGHVTAARISGAEDKNGWFIAHKTSPCESRRHWISNLDLLSEADLLGRGFQTQSVELLKGQRGQELKAAFYLLGHLPESASLFGVRTFYGRRIRRTPVRRNRLAGQIGQFSLALSQSVMTKSNCASLNSSHDLL